LIASLMVSSFLFRFARSSLFLMRIIP
jgi:hypothetical protein